MVELRHRELLDRCANRLARVDVGRNPLAALIIAHMLGQALCIACRQITGLRHNKSRLVVLAAVAHLTAQMAVLILIVNQRLHIAQRVIAPVHLIKHQAKKRIPTLAGRGRAVRLARPIIRATRKRKHMSAALVPHLPHLKQAVIGAVASLNHRLALILAKAFSALGQLCRGKHALIHFRRHPHPLPDGLGLGIVGQLKHSIVQHKNIFSRHAVNYQAFLHKQLTLPLQRRFHMCRLNLQLLGHRLLVCCRLVQLALQSLNLGHIVLRIIEAVILHRVGAVIVLQRHLEPAAARGERGEQAALGAALKVGVVHKLALQ